MPFGRGNKEQEPQSAFAVRVKDLGRFTESILNGREGIIGKMYPSGALSQIEAEISVDETEFDLELRLFSPHGANTKHITDAIKSRYTRAVGRGDNLIITERNGTPFVVSQRMYTKDKIYFVRIATGFGYDKLDNEIKFADSPECTEEGIRTAMQDFVNLTGTVIRESYQVANMPLPNEAFEIDEPKKEKNIEIPQGLAGKIEIEKPDVSFADIGGQQKAKREIEGLSYALKNPALYKKWGAAPPKGILLHGPPGTGKTLLAKALAAESDAHFLHVQATDVLTKWYGESPALVQGVFDFAGNLDQPVIVFIDEIDAIAQPRDSMSSGGSADIESHRVLTTLLENMDGLDSNPNVILVASTNKKDKIDEALLRPGRLSVHVEVPLPDDDGRKETFDIHMRKINENAEIEVFSNVDLKSLVKQTARYSGADIAEILRRTIEEKVRQDGAGKNPGPVTTTDIQAKIAEYEHKKRSEDQGIGFHPNDLLTPTPIYIDPAQ